MDGNEPSFSVIFCRSPANVTIHAQRTIGNFYLHTMLANDVSTVSPYGHLSIFKFRNASKFYFLKIGARYWKEDTKGTQHKRYPAWPWIKFSNKKMAKNYYKKVLLFRKYDWTSFKIFKICFIVFKGQWVILSFSKYVYLLKRFLLTM